MGDESLEPRNLEQKVGIRDDKNDHLNRRNFLKWLNVGIVLSGASIIGLFVWKPVYNTFIKEISGVERTKSLEEETRQKWQDRLLKEFTGLEGVLEEKEDFIISRLKYVHNPIELRTWKDIEKISKDLTKDYVLIDDIDCCGRNFRPIGDDKNSFKGTLNGDGHKILNLKMNSDKDQSLFNYTDEESVIANLRLENVHIEGDYVSGLVGINKGCIYNCQVSGLVKARTSGAGLVLSNQGYIFNSENSSNVSGQSYAGGIVFSNFEGKLINSHNEGLVKGTKGSGGVAGISLRGIFKGCSSKGLVDGKEYVGGICGIDTESIFLECPVNERVNGSTNTGILIGYGVESLLINYDQSNNLVGKDNYTIRMNIE